MKKGVSFEEFRTIIVAFPEVDEALAFGSPIFKVGKKMVARLNEDFADTIVLKIDPALRASLMAGNQNIFFTTPHHEPHPLVLIRLPNIDSEDLRYLTEQAWRMVAPKRALKAFEDRAE